MLLLVAALQVVAGQATGALAGSIIDAQSQNPVAEAVVIASRAEDGGETSVVTTAEGRFFFDSIPTGFYDLYVQREGFQPFTTSGLRVRIATILRVKLQLIPEAVKGAEVVIEVAKPSVSMSTGPTGPDMAMVPPSHNARNFDAVLESVPGVHREAVSPPPRTADLKAGSHDDNLQYNAFLHFLSEHAHRALPHALGERLIVEVRDRDGLPVPGAQVSVRSGEREVLTRRTYADGRALIFTGEVPAGARIRVGALEQPLDQSAHLRSFKLDTARAQSANVPLDIAFILDSTGSMADELSSLKKTLAVIHFQLTHLEPAPDVRFGLVEYKDRGDDFVTRVIPFTRDVTQFRAQLERVQAYGGGDEPEDVQAGLEQALHGLAWRDEGVRLALLIGDAAPHLDYGETFTYLSAAREAAARGIKIATVGCSGLPIQGEVVWREIAQYTMAPFVFLSRGERGDNEGGAAGAGVSHHVGSNWVAENLETIVVRFVKSEVSNLTPHPLQDQRDWFEARAGAPGVLDDLFRQSVKQLVDYSVESLDDRTPTVVLPLAVKSKKLLPLASALESRLLGTLAASTPFKLLENARLPELIRTIEQQLGDDYDSKKLLDVGKLVPARLAVLGQLAEDAAGKAEMLVKLVRLETGELLSLSLLKIDPALLQ